MRSFYAENDLLSGEIQQVNSNGVIHIQTRNLKYGKLKNGMLVKVSHGLVKKKKHQFISLDNDIKAILGINGLIWVYYSTVNVDEDYFTDDKTKIESIEKEEKPLKEHLAPSLPDTYHSFHLHISVILDWRLSFLLDCKITIENSAW